MKWCVSASEDQSGFHKNKQLHSVEVNLTVTGDLKGHCEQPPHVTKETGYQSGEWLSYFLISSPALKRFWSVKKLYVLFTDLRSCARRCVTMDPMRGDGHICHMDLSFFTLIKMLFSYQWILRVEITDQCVWS